MTDGKKSDLDEFPDGGRATLVRRYSPALTKRELGILTECRFPASVRPSDHRRTLALVRAGLLMRDPTSIQVFQITEAGAQVVHLWKSAGWLL